MKIKVIHPFSLRLGTGKPLREFPAGEHEISEAEHGHWFLQACLKDGRAVRLSRESGAEAGKSGSGGGAAPAREELMKLTRDKLAELAALRGVEVAPGATKADICDRLLAEPAVRALPDETPAQTEGA